MPSKNEALRKAKKMTKARIPSGFRVLGFVANTQDFSQLMIFSYQLFAWLRLTQKWLVDIKIVNYMIIF